MSAKIVCPVETHMSCMSYLHKKILLYCTFCVVHISRSKFEKYFYRSILLSIFILTVQLYFFYRLICIKLRQL